MEAAFSFRRRREIGIATMFKKARACGKNLIKRQTSLLQRDCAEKSYIQVSASTTSRSEG